MRTFRVPKQSRPPEPFRFVFEVPEIKLVEHDADDDHPQPWSEEVETDSYVEVERVFHARHRVPGGLVLAAQDLDPSDPTSGFRQAEALRGLFRAGIVEADEFLDLISSTRYVIDPGMLNDVVQMLVELSAQPHPTNAP